MSQSKEHYSKLLTKIQTEISEMLDEAEQIIVDNCSQITVNRMHTQWLPMMRCALSNDSGYDCANEYTMQEAIDELETKEVVNDR